MRHIETGEDVPVGEWMPVIRVIASPHTDSLQVYVSRYREVAEDEDIERQYLAPDATWKDYIPHTTTEPFLIIGFLDFHRSHDPLQVLADELAERIKDAFNKGEVTQ